MKKKKYIQPNIKSLTMEEDLMAAISGGESNGKNPVEVEPGESGEEGGAKDNTWHTNSVWD